MSNWMRFSLFVVLLLGIGIGVLATSVLGKSSDASVDIVEGYVNGVNWNGTAIGVSPENTGAGDGYVIAGAMWRQSGGPWHDTFPTCLEPLTSGQHVRLGVVHAEPTEWAPGRPVVVWLEQLD